MKIKFMNFFKKNVSSITLIVLLSMSFLLAACSSEVDNNSNINNLVKHNYDDVDDSSNRPQDMNQNDRSEMDFDKMISSAADACSGKFVGDSCTITTPRGDVESICIDMDGVVVCEMQKPDGAPKN